jgi:PAS domain S-box-containing protein
MWLDLIQNIALLVTLAVGLQLLARWLEHRRLEFRVLAGLLFGLVGVVGMMTPVHFAPGVIYDGRSIVLSLAGLFGGAVPAAVAALMCGAYRLHLGGAGAPAGVAVVVEAAALGVALRYLRKRNEWWARPPQLLAFGVLVHAGMLALQLLLLPAGMGWEVLRGVGPVVLVGYPLAFLMVAHVFIEGERQRAGVRALAESEERFRSLAELAPIGFVISDQEERTLYVSLKFVEIFGYDRRDMPSVDAWWPMAYPDPEVRERVRREWGAALNEARKTDVPPMEYPVTCKDGKVRQIEFRVATTGELNFVVFADVTERKQAENALRESEYRFRSFVENANDIVYALSPEGAFTYVSPNWRDFMGEPADAAVGKLSERYVHPEDLPICRRFLQEMRSTNTPQRSLEYRVRRCDGTIRWHVSNGAPVRDSDGQVTGYICIARDVTESKQVEDEREKLRAQLAQSQKMESVGRLAGGVAHDFNNMLGVILGHTDLALEQIDPALPLFADLEQVRKAAERSADLTRQLLAFARRQTVAPQVLDLNETVALMLNMLRRLIGEDIDLDWIPAEMLEPVSVDPAQIDQLLANLVVNARDAIGHAGGKIIIETGMAKFDADFCATHTGFTPGKYAVLTVSDNGCGMDEATKAQIFEPFFTTKGVGEGTGLGLATVYGIVKQNSGFINVYSELGQGTSIRVYLPVNENTVAPVEIGPQVELPDSTGHETVLLVEDEPSLLSLTTTMLERLGYRTLAAANAREALRLAEEHAGEIHVLITDVVMPEMNGRDLARNLLALYPNLNCLFMSGYTADVIAHQGVLDEGVNFIQKPFSRNRLGQKVREVLEN